MGMTYRQRTALAKTCRPVIEYLIKQHERSTGTRANLRKLGEQHGLPAGIMACIGAKLVRPIIGVEHWRPIAGHPRYIISDQGRIVVKATGKEPAIEVQHCAGAYHRVKLDGSYRRINRLVLETFIGPSDLDACHRNGDVSDNRLSNLLWGDVFENARHKVEHVERMFTIEQIWKIDAWRQAGHALSYIAERCRDEFGIPVGAGSISGILHRKNYRHFPKLRDVLAVTDAR